MEEETPRPAVSWQNGSLAPVDRLRSDRADSPTPGLVEGTEPGAGQKSAMFVHTQSFEDLCVEAEDEAQKVAKQDHSEGRQAEEFKTLVEEQTSEKQHSKDFSSESRTKEEEDVSSEAWRSHRKHVFVLSKAGKPIYTRYGTEEALSSTMGVMMALVSFVEAEKNIIRSIHTDMER
ncbi:protein SAND-like [Nematolebias whitei]|uniref:protein SAND-like n=1 Tax=Nematolebias whitei TaxID=451745 RepID=UPI0018998268|nr:protein SAND-like [Nematolebias whitei]